jgi:hypothetical protein
MHINQDVREDVFFILSEKFLNLFKNWILDFSRPRRQTGPRLEFGKVKNKAT